MAKAPTLTADMRLVVLHGKESYKVSEWTRRFVEILEEAHGEIEVFNYDGTSATPAEVLDEVRSYGLIQPHKLVILNQAGQFMATEGYRPVMERYAAEPVDSATLLFRGETWRAGKIDKLIKAAGAIVKCEPASGSEATRWCAGRVKKRYDSTIDGTAASMLVDRLGPDLARLDTELAKLAAFVGPGQPITTEAVAELVGLSREEQAWVIQSAIVSGRTEHAVAKLRELLAPGQREVLVAWAISDLLKKVHAAACMLGEGQAPGQIASTLRLWGDSRRLVVDVARRLGPGEAAQLLRASIETDQRTKSGFGVSARSLETLTVRVADTIGSS